jgi:hypothetical protein
VKLKPTFIAGLVASLPLLAGLMSPAAARGAQRIDTFGNDAFRVVMRIERGVSVRGIGSIQLRTSAGWETVATGIPSAEFSTSLGDADALNDASDAKITGDKDGPWRINMSAKTDAFTASETILIDPHAAVFRREQKYQFLRAGEVSIHPGFRIEGPGVRYTYPLNAYESPLAGLPAIRTTASWAVPLPAHIWSQPGWVALYGPDRTRSKGTLDVAPAGDGALIRSYLPDETGGPPPAGLEQPAHNPTTMHVTAGQTVTIDEFFAAAPLNKGDDPLWEGCRLAADVLLDSRPELDWKHIADGVANFYPRCQLWNPDALGTGRGFFSNMWVHTTAGTPAKRGDAAGYYEIGWGEGYGVRIINAIARYSVRTGRTDLLPYANEMTRNIELFRRHGPDPDEPFFDRYHPPGLKSLVGQDVPGGYADFLGYNRIWTHCLAAIGFELLDTYEAVPNYPVSQTRETWLQTARSISRFLAKHQKDNGDIQDGFDEHDHEVNLKKHRIAARAITCGLWAKLARIDHDPALLEHAKRLAHFVEPEITRLDFFNQMLDSHVMGLAGQEVSDPEGAVYALDGLTELYDSTHDPATLALCRRCAGYAFTWTYFYDLPTGYKGHTRGGPICRMPDFRIIYPGAGAEAVRPLLRLSHLTNDPLYRRMAREMLDCAAWFQWTDPGHPWTGGIIDAVDQNSGRQWGPNREGQVNSGMITGTTLTALEIWMGDAAKK